MTDTDAFPLEKFGIHDVVVELQVKETSYSDQISCVASVLHVLHCEFTVQPVCKHTPCASAMNASKIVHICVLLIILLSATQKNVCFVTTIYIVYSIFPLSPKIISPILSLLRHARNASSAGKVASL
jgi:hypothetical protein